MILLNALLTKNKIAEKDVEIVIIGADMTPLLTGQVDVVTGWLTNTTALKALGPDRIDLRLWDAGVQLYALPYYATKNTIEKKPDDARGLPARRRARLGSMRTKNPDKAVDLLVKEYPNLNRDDERRGQQGDAQLRLQRQHQGQWLGRVGPGGLAGADRALRDLGQFTAGTPKVEDVITHEDPRSHQGRPRQGRLSPMAAVANVHVRRSPAAIIGVRFTTERGTVTALENIDLASRAAAS